MGVFRQAIDDDTIRHSGKSRSRFPVLAESFSPLQRFTGV